MTGWLYAALTALLLGYVAWLLIENARNGRRGTYGPCQRCGSDDIDEAGVCRECGEVNWP